MPHEYLLVDAFAEAPMEGNACAVVFDADDLDEGTMQAVAREMNLSETAFVTRLGKADASARYFTPADEIPFAGHPTVATVFSLLVSGRWHCPQEGGRFELDLPAGRVPVDVAARAGRVGRITMEQLAPTFGRSYRPEAVANAFGLAGPDLLEGAPIETVSTGTPQLMVPVANLEALESAVLDIVAYRRLRTEGDFFSAHLFCLGGFTSSGDTAARHFVDPPDLIEDPFTGSATGGMAAYLWRHGMLETPAFVAEQGHPMGRPGKAWVEVIGPRDAIRGVRVGGRAVEVAWGELLLHSSG